MSESNGGINGAEHQGNGAAQAAARGAAQAGARRSLGVRLAPAGNSDQPVMANCVQVSTAPGIAYVDFGFLEPAVLSALPRMAKQGGKLPQAVQGRLAVRVAMGYEGIASLHQQLGKLLLGVSAAAASASAAAKAKTPVS